MTLEWLAWCSKVEIQPNRQPLSYLICSQYNFKPDHHRIFGGLKINSHNENRLRLASETVLIGKIILTINQRLQVNRYPEYSRHSWEVKCHQHQSRLI